jgi:mono/diheme cytochrome c family protein
MDKRIEGVLQILVLASAVVLAAVLPIGSSPAQSPEAEQPETADSGAVVGSVSRGRVSYRIYCASCHGPAAHGDGPVSGYLKIPPKDLALLAKANGGTFPEAKIFAAIDGRSVVPSHGPRDMPVWGLSFQETGKNGSQEREVQERIADLVEFIKTIQK